MPPDWFPDKSQSAVNQFVRLYTPRCIACVDREEIALQVSGQIGE